MTPAALILLLSCATAAAFNVKSDLTAATASLTTEFSEGLKQQTLKQLRENGESITIMVCGESGLGKTSLLSSLFHTELVWPNAPTSGSATPRIAEQNVVFDLEGMPFSARLIDTPGYDVDLHKEFAVVSGRLDAGFRKLLQQERRIRRKPKDSHTTTNQCVDVVLYFFAPHRCKRADMKLLKRLQGKVSIVPVLAKADSMTADELAAFRVEVTQALEKNKISIAHAPVAVICAARPAGGEPLGREYPWGLAESEARGHSDRQFSPAHSEIEDLRRFLLIDGLLDLKQRSVEHYEAFRGKYLFSQTMGVRALFRSLLSTTTQIVLASLLLASPRKYILNTLQTAKARLPTLPSLPRLIPTKRLPPPPSEKKRRKGGRKVPPPPPEKDDQPPPPPGKDAPGRRKGLRIPFVSKVIEFIVGQ